VGLPQFHIMSCRAEGEWIVSERDYDIGFEQEQASRVSGLPSARGSWSVMVAESGWSRCVRGVGVWPGFHVLFRPTASERAVTPLQVLLAEDHEACRECW
jgi:hypothetical protein